LSTPRSYDGRFFESNNKTHALDRDAPLKRSRYLAEIVEEVERYDRWADEQVAAAEKLYRLHGAGEAEGAENASLQVTALAAGTGVRLTESRPVTRTGAHRSAHQLRERW
jgi:hypothetical protein